MATVGAVCYMQTNQLCLTLIGPNIDYDPVRFVKPQTSYVEIWDDPSFIAVCRCDSRAKHESDNEESIDTQPEPSFDNRFKATIDRNLDASIDSWEDEDHQKSFSISTAIPTCDLLNRFTSWFN